MNYKSLLFLFILLFISRLYCQGTTETSLKVFLEKVTVDKHFEYHKVFNKNYREPLGKGYYWDRQNWANAANIKETFKKYVVQDSGEYFLKYADIDKNTLFLKLRLNSFYLKEIEEKAIIEFDYTATNYQGTVLKTKKHAEIEIPVVSVSIFSLTEHFLAIELIDKLKDLLQDVDVSGKEPYEKMNVNALLNEHATVSDNPQNSPYINNAIALKKNKNVLSGLLVSEKGYAITDYRFFRRYEDTAVTAQLNDGSTSEIELIRVNKIHNLALIKLKNTAPLSFQPFKLTHDLSLRKALKFWGTPGIEKLINSYQEGIVSGKMKRDKTDYYFVDTMPHWGYTGTGIYDEAFRLVGVALLVNFDDKLNLVMPCISAGEIQDKLNINFQ